jgi:hypothetical protein
MLAFELLSWTGLGLVLALIRKSLAIGPRDRDDPLTNASLIGAVIGGALGRALSPAALVVGGYSLLGVLTAGLGAAAAMYIAAAAPGRGSRRSV